MWSALRGHTLNKRFHKWLHWVYAKCNFGSQTVQINPWPTNNYSVPLEKDHLGALGWGGEKNKTKTKPNLNHNIENLLLHFSFD